MTNGEKIQTILDIDRDCTEVHSDNGTITFTVTSDFWNAEYKESDSLIEEKCPCYYCEHFEIKGWSHCKIHEDAYGDSRCNDYHKVNQGSNKSEIPTGSIVKNDVAVDCIPRADVNRIICEYRDDAAETGTERGLERAYGANAIGALISELPSVTPQKPRCKECKWWKDSDGKYRRGLGAESRCPINSHAVYCGDGYCYMFSPKIDMREVEK